MKKIILILLGIAVLVLLVSFFAIFFTDNDSSQPVVEKRVSETFVLGNDNQDEDDLGDTEVNTLADENPDTAAGSTIGFEAPSEDVCPLEEKRKANERDVEYYEGKAVVSFEQTVTQDEAVATVEALGYRPNSDQVKTYRQNYFFSVFVDSGEEFNAICALRDEPGVKNATLDYKLDLVL